MRILVISQSYWPDQSGYLYGEIVDRFVSDRHQVDVITYNNLTIQDRIEKKQGNNPNVTRINIIKKFQNNRLGKLLNTIIFGISIIFIVISKKKYDKIICACSHLLFIGLISSFVSRIYNSKFIYSIGDLHPESGLASGDFKNKFLVRVLKLIDTLACEAAQFIVVLSDDMVESIKKRKISNFNKIIKIPNIPHNNLKKISHPKRHKILKKEKNKFRIVFTGNIGRFQGLEIIIEAMRLLKNEERVEIIFLGSGVIENKLKQISKELLNKSVFFIKPKDIKFVNSLIDSADVGLVSLLDGVEKCAFPSKMSGYLSMHCPVLAVANVNSELYKMTVNFKIGVASPQNDAFALSKLILKISNQENFKEKYRINIKNIMSKFYSKNRILDQWSELI